MLGAAQRCGNLMRKAKRDLANGANVLRHVFAVFTITARSGLHQHALLIAQVHGQAIKLEFGHVFHRRVGVCQRQFLAHAGIKGLCAGGLRIGFSADAEHGHRVAHAGKGIQRLAAHALGGGIGRDQFGVRGLYGLQGLKQAVVLGIGNLRVVQHVVAMGVRMKLVAQAVDFGSIRQEGV